MKWFAIMISNLNTKNLILKALTLFVAFNFFFAFVPFEWGNFSVYGWLVPARTRFPFGENPDEAHNFSLFDIDAMFAAHEVSHAVRNDIPHASRSAGYHPASQVAEFRVFVIGDSSVWGALLRPEQTLSAQLNRLAPRVCGQSARYYNLGYPTLSLTKDLMLLDAARPYDPDLVLWLVTLEAFPLEKQLDAPLVAHNPERTAELISRYDLPLAPLPARTLWERTLWSRRRDLADIFRLQLHGFMWGWTGVDQPYPEHFSPAQTDFDIDGSFHAQAAPPLAHDQLAFPILAAGQHAAGAPVILVNEPILVSDGVNSHLRYNFFYPRWAYDDYRALMQVRATQNGWDYIDLWDLVPAGEFTDSAIHLTPRGETMLAESIAAYLEVYGCSP